VLTKEERERYQRQIIINRFGEEGQEKLKRAKVFIGGAGGLGSPIALYLAAAGVGTLRIVDDDTIELSNLNRQILHWQENIGMLKTESAAGKLKKMNPDIKIDAIHERITGANAAELVDGFDGIVDAMDNLATRYLLNKTALEKNVPFFHGAIYGFEGRVMTVLPRKTACLNCLYHGAPDPHLGKCPVIGVTPGVIGCIQATEVIKYITGIGKLLTDRMLVYDGIDMTFTELKIRKFADCEHCGNLKCR
jgi:molybdopterin-synthase adenylyltransferase